MCFFFLATCPEMGVRRIGLSNWPIECTGGTKYTGKAGSSVC